MTTTRNGFVSFGSPCPIDCYDNFRTFPSTSSAFHNVIAPWWDDFEVLSPGVVQYKLGPSQAEIEFKNVEQYFGSGSVTFKVTLTSSGVFQIHYGSAGGSGLNGLTGWENATGTQGAAILSCPFGTCDNSDFPTNTLYTIGQPVLPDLIVDQVKLGSAQKTGSTLDITVNPTFRNFGQNPANGFVWRAYLSTDRQYDAADTLITTSTTPLNCPGGQTVSDSASATVPAPPNGNYFVIG